MHKQKIIEGYKISSHKIGQGAFGCVYLGEDEKGEQLAVKIIQRQKVDGRVSSFLHNEILALKNCQNQHIVRLVALKKTTSYYYVFLEYCEEGDLAKYIKVNGKIPEQKALEFFYQIIKGFRTIVKKSLMHRDLKPANIFLKNGQIKIGDFGLAKLLSPDTMAHTFAGSPYNMAPQILRHEEYDSKADIYSIGTVLYEMLFASPPFVGSSHLDLIQQIKLRRFHKFQAKLISKQTASLLARLLKQNPQDRMSWQQLFNYETRRKSKVSDKLYDKYHDFLSKINSSRLCSIPSIFCLLNADYIQKNVHQQDASMMDLNLSSNLFVNLIKSTTIEQDGQQHK